MIVLGPNSVALWFFPVTLAKDRGDLLGHAERTDEGTRVVYRHRWYAEGDDQDPFNGRDRKTWKELRTKDAPEIVIPKLARIFDTMADAAQTPIAERYFIERGTMSAYEFVELCMSQPFMHRKAVPVHAPGHA